MDTNFDIIIIGGGIAGVSAAMTALNRGKKLAVITNPPETQNLYKAESVTNYPGIINMSGRDFAQLLHEQLEKSDAQLIHGRALSVMDFGGSFGVAVGNDYYSAKAVILALGITREKLYPGEGEYLGRGVSYCATCDGMLYKNKTVALIGSGHEAELDVEFLRGICKEVLHFTDNKAYTIKGGMKADTVSDGENDYAVDGVFIIKDTVSVTKLVQGLEYRKGGIVVDEKMQTNIPGIFAAGDCAGLPYQLAKAAGDGNIAALSACDYLKGK